MGTLREAMTGGDPAAQVRAAKAWLRGKGLNPQVLDHGLLVLVDDDMNVVERRAYMTALLRLPVGGPLGTEYARQMVLAEATYKDPDLRELHRNLTMIALLRDLMAKGILQ